MAHPYHISKYKSNWKTYYRILKNVPGQPEIVVFHTPVKSDFEKEFKRLVFEWQERKTTRPVCYCGEYMDQHDNFRGCTSPREMEHPTTRHFKAEPLERKPHAR
jgi:hypothetical protein